MYPELLNIGFLHIKTYGVCVATGFMLCWWLLEKITGRKDLGNLVLALVVAGIAGARTAYVIENWGTEFAAHPGNIIRIDQGGLVFYGGLILSCATYFIWCWRTRTNPAGLGDALAAVVPLGHALGRIGCFFYGCCYGRVCLVSSFGVRFPRFSPAWHEQVAAGMLAHDAPASLPVLPTQLIESAALLVLFALVISIYMALYRRRQGLVAHGVVVSAYLCGYALLRFPLEYLRGDPRAVVGPFSIAQTISLGVFLVGVVCGLAALRSRRWGRRILASQK